MCTHGCLKTFKLDLEWIPKYSTPTPPWWFPRLPSSSCSSSSSPLLLLLLLSRFLLLQLNLLQRLQKGIDCKSKSFATTLLCLCAYFHQLPAWPSFFCSPKNTTHNSLCVCVSLSLLFAGTHKLPHLQSYKPNPKSFPTKTPNHQTECAQTQQKKTKKTESNKMGQPPITSRLHNPHQCHTNKRWKSKEEEKLVKQTNLISNFTATTTT